jgi:hypothetical protein
LFAAGVVGAFIADIIACTTDVFGATVAFRTWVVVVTGAAYKGVDTAFDHVAHIVGARVVVVAAQDDLGAAHPADAAAEGAVQFHVAGRPQWTQFYGALARLLITDAFAAVAGEVSALVVLGAFGDRRNVRAHVFVDDGLAS